MIRSHSITLYVVRCDRCDNQTRTVADGLSSEEAAVHDAIWNGWQVIGNEQICPRCYMETCS